MKHEHFWTMIAAASATALVIGGAATAALAQQQRPSTTVIGERPAEGELSVSVSYRDLNLAAARDEQRLHLRVKGAARLVCQPNDDQLVNRPFSNCVAIARESALPQVDLAVKRAREIASKGRSSIPLVAIAVVGVR